MVEGALGAEWLAEQERRAGRQRFPVSDAHKLYRLLQTPTDEAHAEICELALYLRTFAADHAIKSVLQDLRTEKYCSILHELAFAYRWQDSGAEVHLRPATRTGEADFGAAINGLSFIVEASAFPDEAFKEPRFRLPMIIADAQSATLGDDRRTVRMQVVINAYPSGNCEAEIRLAAVEASKQFRQAVNAPRTASFATEFCAISIEETEPDPSRNIFIEDAEGESWDICIQGVQRQIPVGTPIYNVLDHPPVAESSRIFIKFPAFERDPYRAIYRKLKREAAQLSGVAGPRVVILETKALGDVSGLDERALQDQIARVARSIPELACVWLTMREWKVGVGRHKYRSWFVPNPDSVYQLPFTFLRRCGHREWEWDHLGGEEYPARA